MSGTTASITMPAIVTQVAMMRDVGGQPHGLGDGALELHVAPRGRSRRGARRGATAHDDRVPADVDGVRLQRPGRRAGAVRALQVVVAVVAGAPDVLEVLPVLDDAGQVRADGRERPNLSAGRPDQDGRPRAELDDPPAVGLEAACGQVERDARRAGLGDSRRDQLPRHGVEHRGEEGPDAGLQKPGEDGPAPHGGARRSGPSHGTGLRHLAPQESRQTARSVKASEDAELAAPARSGRRGESDSMAEPRLPRGTGRHSVSRPVGPPAPAGSRGAPAAPPTGRGGGGTADRPRRPGT